MLAFRWVLILATLPPTAVDTDKVSKERLWSAAQQGDVSVIKKLLADGVGVDEKTAYGATALVYACDRGHLEVVRVLLDAGADSNTKDTFYKSTPLGWAAYNRHAAVVELLLEHGADGADNALLAGASIGAINVVRAVLKHAEPKPRTIASARTAAESRGHEEIVKLLNEHTPAARAIDQSKLMQYVGTYEQADGSRLEISLEKEKLRAAIRTFRAVLVPLAEHKFDLAGSTIEFKIDDGRVIGLKLTRGESTVDYRRTVSKKTESAPDREVPSVEGGSPYLPELAASGINWPSFRGTGARGVADGQRAPATWDVPGDVNVRWKTPIAGLGHSSPVVWGDRIFLTTAVRADGEAEIRTGLYGDVDSVEDDSVHQWQVICLDKSTGDVLWRRTAHEGVPQGKRHLKSSHANPTAATDGRHVVAFFGSEGLHCYDFDGRRLWKKDLGSLDSGWFFDAGYQWGFASSPIIFENMVIVQCDIQTDSFVAAFDVATGKRIWHTPRDEIPGWATPTVYQNGDSAMLITNATRHARGYDAFTGKQLWRLAGNSEITVPTPFVAHDLIYVSSGYRPVQPIYAIRPDAKGDITLDEDQKSNQYIAWSNRREGPYMPSPIVYGDYLYTCGNGGIVRCHDAKTGERLYRKRLGKAGRASFLAAPIAADGRIYFTAEDGNTYVVAAGPKFELLHTNPVGENCFATPAISEGLFLIRTQRHLIALGDPARAQQ